MVFIRRCVSILELAGRILEEWLPLFETLVYVLEEKKLILEVPSDIRTSEIMLEHFMFY